jgi:hypothetical protein
MTHTLNRTGLSEERPGEEIIFLGMVQQKQKTEKASAMREMAETVLKYKPLNIISAPLGFNDQEVIDICVRAGIVTAVFSKRDDIRDLVKDIKSRKLGISVVLSGLFSDIQDICADTGLEPHTYNIPLGIFGKTERLPDKKTLEITTQCGHALISPHLVAHIVQKIKKGKMSSAEGAKMLVKPCFCGIGNPKRFEKILDDISTS